jgi:hypothetical protein
MKIRFLLILLCYIVSTSLAWPANERLEISQLANGHIAIKVSATLTSGCPEPETNLSGMAGGTFSVLTWISTNCLEGNPSEMYTATVDLGPVANGDYNVVWGYANGFGTFGSTVRQTFSIRNGTLLVVERQPIPALQRPYIAILIVLLLGIFAARLRTKRRYGPADEP